MQRVGLIHWNADEAEQGVSRLRASGYHVDYDPEAPTALRLMRDRPPAAVVIDLSRLPAQGRDIGLALRHYKSTRHGPLIFAGGGRVPEKVTRVKRHLPDAVYTSWSRIKSALKRAIAHPRARPVVPKSLLEGYSRTPLPKKLGIRADSVGAEKVFRHRH